MMYDIEKMAIYLVWFLFFAGFLALGAWICDVLEARDHKRKQDRLVRQSWKTKS